MKIIELNVPLYRALKVIRGDLESILKTFEEIEDKQTWIEVHIRDKNPFFANQSVRAKAEELGLILLAVKIDKAEQALSSDSFDVISLEEVNPLDVFRRRMEQDELLEDESLTQALVENFEKIVDEVKNV